LENIWTDDASLLPPADQTLWWEVWINSEGERVNLFRQEAAGRRPDRGRSIAPLPRPGGVACLWFPGAIQAIAVAGGHPRGTSQGEGMPHGLSQSAAGRADCLGRRHPEANSVFFPGTVVRLPS